METNQERLTADIYEREGIYEVYTLDKAEESSNLGEPLALITLPNSPACLAKLKAFTDKYNSMGEKSLNGLIAHLRQIDGIEVILYSEEEEKQFERRLREIVNYDEEKFKEYFDIN